MPYEDMSTMPDPTRHAWAAKALAESASEGLSAKWAGLQVITADDITNLKITLATSQDVQDVIERI